MSGPALILFGHGARDPEWARPMERLSAAVRAADPAREVRLAFLEFMSPSLGEAIDQLAASGLRQIRVVPVFLAQGGHVRRDVPRILDEACERHPGLSITLADALGEAQPVLDAMAAVALAAR